MVDKIATVDQCGQNPGFLPINLLCHVSVFADACVKFLIDMGEELLILYEHIYEIYGDIQGAINSFKMGAYEQG